MSSGYYNSDEDSDSSSVTNISYRENPVKYVTVTVCLCLSLICHIVSSSKMHAIRLISIVSRAISSPPAMYVLLFIIRVFKKKARTSKARSKTPTRVKSNGVSGRPSPSISHGKSRNAINVFFFFFKSIFSNIIKCLKS